MSASLCFVWLLKVQKQFHTKNQHYVPQFYLRNFSNDEKVFHLLNLSSGKNVDRARIKCQCSEDYFYGNDGLIEKNLGAVEEECSQWLKQCLSWDDPKKELPVIIRCWLARFAAIQYMRTKKNIEFFSDSDKLYSKLLSSLYERDYGPDSIPDIYKEKDYSNLPGLSFIAAILNCGALIDLTAVLLDNETDEDFVVSDNPVVFQNPLIEKFAQQNCSGFCTRGLQIYYPLSPRRMVCLYDADAYKYEGRNIIRISSKRDVESLNNLQFMNADKNVYSKTEMINPEKYISFRNDFVSKQDEPVRMIENRDAPGMYLIQQSSIIPKVGFKLSIFKFKPAMLREAYEKDPVFIWNWVRNPTLCSWVQEFVDLVERGQWNWLEFSKFYEKKLKELQKNDFGLVY